MLCKLEGDKLIYPPKTGFITKDDRRLAVSGYDKLDYVTLKTEGWKAHVNLILEPKDGYEIKFVGYQEIDDEIFSKYEYVKLEEGIQYEV